MPGAPNRTGHFATGSDNTQADGLPQMPATITAAAAAKWNELLDQLPRPALRSIDCHQLRILAELLALVDVQTVAAAANPTDPKLSRMLLQTAQQVHRLSSCFGLTPADRARLRLPTDEEPDELQLFLEQWS